MAAHVFHLFLLLFTFTLAQYNDDSDYNNFEFYETIPTTYERSANENYQATGPDDFYIISDLEDAANARDSWNSGIEDLDRVFENEIANEKFRIPSERERDLYKRQEKIYRYTKHRIPGYDYDELDFMSARGFQQCDEKSVWTNCVCQFTCQHPNVVDCFTPCKNGCECKEDYVFDEKTKSCILPEHCEHRTKDYSIYEK
ncbi:uncharacterized protein [Venturia canescens]|uniref:uncharacterized protein n=1 Tax=Venturia canescens TaxID=32260 RepID=UPI001C9C4339|nr:uncharacterized protein LOC122417250 [Venturia canescens]